MDPDGNIFMENAKVRFKFETTFQIRVSMV